MPSADPGPLHTLSAVRERCIPLSNLHQGSGPADYRECAVAAFGDLGIVDGESYFFAVYCLIPNWSPIEDGVCAGDGFNAQRYDSQAVVVFAGRDSTRLRVEFERAHEEIGLQRYIDPSISDSPAGTLLELPIAMDGTGNYNVSEYYLREDGGWQRIESESWLKDLDAKLPAGLEVWKGVWPDPATLRAKTGLWKEGDGNCCPTGGVAHIQLGIRGRKFVLESLTVAPAP
jgi:hypothetical protein